MEAGEQERFLIDLARKHNAVRTRLINEIAEWVAAEVKDRGKLDHHDAANAIRQRHRYDVMALSKPVIETQERDDRGLNSRGLPI